MLHSAILNVMIKEAHRAARILHEGIRGSGLVVVPDAGHMSFVEAKARYLDAVRSFLRAASAA